jgi:hypothetical protein
MTEQIDRDLIEAMVADIIEEAQRRIESQPPRIITVYGDDEQGTAPTAAQMEEARELAGPRDIIFAVAYTASDITAAAAVEEAINTFRFQY